LKCLFRNSAIESATDDLLHTQLFVVRELSSDACHEEASATTVTTAPGKEKARCKAPLRMVAARHRSSNCRLPSARPAVQPEYTVLLVTVNPLVYFFENSFPSSRQTVRIVLSVVCVEGRIRRERKVLERILVLRCLISVLRSTSCEALRTMDISNMDSSII
jgi:hypothetical protein